jgi:hypothetical protein
VINYIYGNIANSGVSLNDELKTYDRDWQNPLKGVLSPFD